MSRSRLRAQPVQSHRQHLLAGFVPVAAHVVALVKPGVKPPGGVPLGEGAHRGGVHPRLAEDVVEAVVVHNVGEIPWAAGQPAVSGGAAVAHRPVVDAEHPADQRGPGGQAGRVRAVVLVKADALPADRGPCWGWCCGCSRSSPCGPAAGLSMSMNRILIFFAPLRKNTRTILAYFSGRRKWFAANCQVFPRGWRLAGKSCTIL